MKKLILTLLLSALVACGGQLSGTYEDAIGVTRYTFSANNKVLFSTLGTELELNYSVEGDQVKIKMNDNTTIVLNKQSDGTLKGPLGMTLSKKQ